MVDKKRKRGRPKIRDKEYWKQYRKEYRQTDKYKEYRKKYEFIYNRLPKKIKWRREYQVRYSKIKQKEHREMTRALDSGLLKLKYIKNNEKSKLR